MKQSWRSVMHRCAAVTGMLVLLAGVLTPTAQAAFDAPAPVDIAVSQDGFKVSGLVMVDDTQTVGTVTVQVGSKAPVVIARPDGSGNYNKILTEADFGSDVVFRATAVSMIAGRPVTSDVTVSETLVFRRTDAPLGIAVTQDDMTLSVDVTFADSTMLALLEMKVGGFPYTTLCDESRGDNCGDGPYDHDMTAGQLGKTVLFRVTAASSADPIPNSVSVVSDPYIFAQSPQPSALTLTQNGYDLNIAVGLVDGQEVGDVTAYTATSPDGEAVDPTDGEYVYNLAPEDIGHLVRVTATALTPGLAMSTVKSAAITPGIAATPKFGAVQQWSTVVSVPVGVASGTTLNLSATIDGVERPVTLTQGVARVAIGAADADAVIVFYAHGSKDGLPDSEEIATDDLAIVAADMPSEVILTHKDDSLCAKPTLEVKQTIGNVTASIDGVDRAVTVGAGTRCIKLRRSDVGKEVVFSAAARHVGQVDSIALDSDPYLIEATTRPKITLSQKGRVVTATIKVTSGQKIGVVTYTKTKSKSVVLRPMRGKYIISVKPADVGKKIIVKAFATKSGFFPSVTLSSKAWTIRK